MADFPSLSPSLSMTSPEVLFAMLQCRSSKEYLDSSASKRRPQKDWPDVVAQTTHIYLSISLSVCVCVCRPKYAVDQIEKSCIFQSTPPPPPPRSSESRADFQKEVERHSSVFFSLDPTTEQKQKRLSLSLSLSLSFSMILS